MKSYLYRSLCLIVLFLFLILSACDSESYDQNDGRTIIPDNDIGVAATKGIDNSTSFSELHNYTDSFVVKGSDFAVSIIEQYAYFFSINPLEYKIEEQYVNYLFDTSQYITGKIVSCKSIENVYDSYPSFLDDSLILTLESSNGKIYEFLFPAERFLIYSYNAYSMNWSLINTFEVTIFFKGNASDRCFSSTVMDQVPTHEINTFVPFVQSVKEHVLSSVRDNLSEPIITSESALDILAYYLGFSPFAKEKISPDFYYYHNGDDVLFGYTFNIGDSMYSFSNESAKSSLLDDIQKVSTELPSKDEGIYYIFVYNNSINEKTDYYMVFANDLRIVKIE
ncbi:MAG: hypothetical protein IJG64_00205 [Oscillospiraceae bacterium]|nr:hypothetical protein [Oscillospiraceae bacterium]